MNSPVLIFLAGPNGAGKSTFYETYLKELGLYFLNADEITKRLDISNEEAAQAADQLRLQLLAQRTSFITETVFSDAVGAKLKFLHEAVAAGYDVRLIYIGLETPQLSEARVFQRVLQGGHDVPTERLQRRYEQSLKNLAAAIKFVPLVTVYDNTSNEFPFRAVMTCRNGVCQMPAQIPRWLETGDRRRGS